MAIRALNERDVDAYLALCAPDWSLDSVVSQIEGTLTGEEGVRRFFAMMDDTASEFHIEVDEMEELGDGRVLAVGRAVAVSLTQEVPVEIEIANVYDVADGTLRRVRAFTDRAEAEQAIG